MARGLRELAWKGGIGDFLGRLPETMERSREGAFREEMRPLELEKARTEAEYGPLERRVGIAAKASGSPALMDYLYKRGAGEPAQVAQASPTLRRRIDRSLEGVPGEEELARQMRESARKRKVEETELRALKSGDVRAERAWTQWQTAKRLSDLNPGDPQAQREALRAKIRMNMVREAATSAAKAYMKKYGIDENELAKRLSTIEAILEEEE